MFNYDQNINLIPNEPGLKDLLDYFKKLIKLEFCCHHIGTIQSFNSTNQTAQITINYTKTFLEIDEIGNTTTTTKNYPTLLECPVICLGGGLGSLTFPITTGDECLIFFNDRDLDNWFNGSSNSAPATARLHAFTDAVALVGVRSLPNVLTGYDSSSVVLKLGENTLKVESDNITSELAGGNSLSLMTDKVIASLSSGVSLEIDSTGKLKITNATGEFVAMLVQLFTDIQNGLVTTMLGPQPLVMPTFAADLTQFETFKA